MPRRSRALRLPPAIALVACSLVLAACALAIAAPKAVAAAENEPASTLTTVMQNFDLSQAQTFTLATREGDVLFGGWVNLTKRNGYIRYYPGTRDELKVIITPYVQFAKRYGKRCWTRKRTRFSYNTGDSLANVDMATVLRKSENQLLYEETRDGVRSQVTVTYDTATLLPSRFDVGVQDEATGETAAIVQTVSYTTPVRPPKPGRICKTKRKR